MEIEASNQNEKKNKSVIGSGDFFSLHSNESLNYKRIDGQHQRKLIEKELNLKEYK